MSYLSVGETEVCVDRDMLIDILNFEPDIRLHIVSDDIKSIEQKLENTVFRTVVVQDKETSYYYQFGYMFNLQTGVVGESFTGIRVWPHEVNVIKFVPVAK